MLLFCRINFSTISLLLKKGALLFHFWTLVFVGVGSKPLILLRSAQTPKVDGTDKSISAHMNLYICTQINSFRNFESHCCQR